MFIIVATKPKGGTAFDTKRKSIDWNNSSDRTWLKNHTHWAMLNAHMITLYPMSESN